MKVPRKKPREGFQRRFDRPTKDPFRGTLLVVTWTGEALEYPPMVMGTENCSRKTGRVPNFPGNTKSKRDHSSLRWFCRGDPDKMIRCGVENCNGKKRNCDVPLKQKTQFCSNDVI